MHMADTPSARDRILDAFEELLAEQSERAATLDGVLARLSAHVDADLDRMRSAPEGPVAYFIRTSVPTDNDLERSIVAVARLAQSADSRARDALSAMQRSWLSILESSVGDPLVARIIMLIGDGMYYNTALLPDTNAVLRSETDMDRVIELVKRLADF